MDTIGIDLHKRESQLYIGQADGTITEQRIVTYRPAHRLSPARRHVRAELAVRDAT